MNTPTTQPTHTPGPWHCDGSRYQSTGPRIYKQWGNAGNQQLIADASAHDAQSPECLANARLIAAAPDLLAACKSAFRCLDDEDTTEVDWRKARKECEAAIAKSGGVA